MKEEKDYKGFILEGSGIKLPKQLSKGQKRFLRRFDAFMSGLTLRLSKILLLIFAIIVVIVIAVVMINS